jgi:hypothetical protein
MAAVWPALAATILLLGSCANEARRPQAGPGSPSTAVAGQEPGDLWNRSFVAERIVFDGEQSPVDERAYLYVTFAGGEGIIRWGNCNHTGEDGNVGPRRVQIRQDDALGFGQTEIGCPESLEDQLHASMRFFFEDPYWRLDGSRLILSSDDSVIELVETEFSRSLSPPPPD